MSSILINLHVELLSIFHVQLATFRTSTIDSIDIQKQIYDSNEWTFEGQVGLGEIDEADKCVSPNKPSLQRKRAMNLLNVTANSQIFLRGK